MHIAVYPPPRSPSSPSRILCLVQSHVCASRVTRLTATRRRSFLSRRTRRCAASGTSGARCGATVPHHAGIVSDPQASAFFAHAVAKRSMLQAVLTTRHAQQTHLDQSSPEFLVGGSVERGADNRPGGGGGSCRRGVAVDAGVRGHGGGAIAGPGQVLGAGKTHSAHGAWSRLG